jgi:chromosome segregation ATPase
LKEERRRLLGQIDDTTGKLEEGGYKLKDLEKVMRELEYDLTKLDKQNRQVQGNNQNVTSPMSYVLMHVMCSFWIP